MAKITATSKIFSEDPMFLEQVGERILNEFAPNCRISRVMPTDRGDYHILLTVYQEAQR